LRSKRKHRVRDEVVQIEYFKSAASFLRALHPANHRWQPAPWNWIFRGHADATWTLRPAALRLEAWSDFISFDPEKIPEALRTANERLLLRCFGEALDRIGLQMPGISRMKLEQLKPESASSPQWLREYLDLAALAQHHGIPTRLLDFSRHGLVAAYFAAQKPSRSHAKHLCVWVLDKRFLEHGNRCDGIWFSVANASRASNPNLHAQSGIFVLWSGSDRVLSLDQIIRRVATGKIRLCSGNLRMKLPVIRKIVLPRTEVKKLLGLLVLERITGATVYPGVDGVARELRERGVHNMPRDEFGVAPAIANRSG
jgi:hypothetical protein